MERASIGDPGGPARTRASAPLRQEVRGARARGGSQGLRRLTPLTGLSHGVPVPTRLTPVGILFRPCGLGAQTASINSRRGHFFFTGGTGGAGSTESKRIIESATYSRQPVNSIAFFRLQPSRLTSTVSADRGSRTSVICSRCRQPAPGYDQLRERRFEFIPLWGFFVFLASPLNPVA